MLALTAWLSAMFLFCSVSAQQTFDFSGESFGFFLNGGESGGYWLYNRGSNQQEVFNTRGFDRTRFAPFVPVSAGIYFSAGSRGFASRVYLHAEVFRSWLVENEMQAMEQTSWEYHGYDIADFAVALTGAMAGAEVIYLGTPRWRFSLVATAGSFMINTQHPQADSFNTRICWKFQAPCRFSIARNFMVEAGPQYHAYRMGVKDSPWRNVKHSMNFVGFFAGVRFGLKRRPLN